MCGIVGYIGSRQAVPILMDGLSKLSYRGYDSAGIAVINSSGKIEVCKAKGKLKQLEDKLIGRSIGGTMGIGHTRWATHGEPSDLNAHPHTDVSGGIAVVHNGILENDEALRTYLKKNGVTCSSQTDTEVIAHLLNDMYDGDMLQAIRRTLPLLEGSYALGIMCDREPDVLYCVKNDSPLVVGFHEGEGYLASDIPAILQYTRDVVFLDDREIGVLDRSGLKVYDAYGQSRKHDSFHIEWEQKDAEKSGFPHFMLKEIFEQPEAMQRTIGNRLEQSEWLPITDDEARQLKKITIVACGTAYHAGVYGKYVLESMAHIPVEVDIASEYRYRNAIITTDELVIAISQSGETADTLAAVRYVKNNGGKILAVTNTVGSSLAREAGEQRTIYTYAGPEIAVASTKAYLTQVTALSLIAFVLARVRGVLDPVQTEQWAHSLAGLPDQLRMVLSVRTQVQQLVARYVQKKHIFFVGRGLDYALSMEAALKLKEISYLCGEAYAAGELKHGPLALIEPGKLVVACVTQPELLDKSINNLQEVITRGAQLLVVTTEELQERIKKLSDEVIAVPNTLPCLAPMLAAVPMQLFAYYMAVERGCDVDQPRNLAKSVTVE